MAAKEPDSNARLEDRIKRWRIDHIQGDMQVVIKRRQRSGPVPLDEFGNTRLTFQHAVNELEETLLAHLRSSIEEVALDVRRLGMPAPDACTEYETCSERKTQEYRDRFRQELTDLRTSNKELWDEYERPFSEREIQGLIDKFECSVDDVRRTSVSAFRTAVWSDKERTGVKSNTDTSAARRRAFVQPILDDKGWSHLQFAEKAGLDKNVIRDYLTGTTKEPRKATLAALAAALGIKVADLPK